MESDAQPHHTEAGPPAGALAFLHGDPQNGITLSTEGALLRIVIRGDPPVGALVGCFRDALAAGALNPSMRTLVDLNAFNGRVDWPSVREVKSLMPWGNDETRASRVAYLTQSLWFGALLKLVTELYPRTHHQQFADEAGAVRWLLDGTL